MNLASQSGEAGAGQLLFANFNQDNTSLAVGSKSGYKFFSLSSVDKLEQIYECTDTEDVCIVERLFSSSLVAIVSLKAPRKLKVCHFKKGTEICNYSYSNTILAVKLNRQRLIVCLEESLYIHNIRDMKVLHTIRETPPNPAGLCALSIHNDNGYLAYPGSATIGEVQVFDTMNLRAANMIPAHDSPLAALAFDSSGTKLATASEKVRLLWPGRKLARGFGALPLTQPRHRTGLCRPAPREAHVAPRLERALPPERPCSGQARGVVQRRCACVSSSPGRCASRGRTSGCRAADVLPARAGVNTFPCVSLPSFSVT
ncbi:WD repeat domain phosphoinositide-interacting protein 2 [Leptonychotes weddellii]|uniref:WD repeat domain phosphoinositide-interacting protein 2 n=1 Tax=Leptonychotes weddellii TaxID=9713 RepID=A0A7F8QVG5_LEPWE|nr:WD repeat domain phosphoinositide-interacting protein 2 [Leptonychotes weddellii]